MIIEPDEFRSKTKIITIKIWALYFIVAVLIYLVSPNNLTFVICEIFWLIMHSAGSAIWWKSRENNFRCLKCGNKCEDISPQVSNVNTAKTIIRHCNACNIDYQLGSIGDNNPML